MSENKENKENNESGKNSDVITISKNNLWKYSTLILLAAVVIWFAVSYSRTTGSVVNQGASDFSFVEDSALYPSIGPDNAEVTVIEFFDFQCPFCGRFFTQTLPLIEEQYLKTGKVKFVYRDFPLSSIHPMAQKSAEASECADEQGKYWEYHDKIFAEQSSLSINSLKQWASDIGMDTAKFNDCLDSGKYESEVKSDLNDAMNSGGRGTPYFLVGNVPLSGAQPFSAFQQAIDSQL